ERDKPREGVVANTLSFSCNGRVGFIDWLGLFGCQWKTVRLWNLTRLLTVVRRRQRVNATHGVDTPVCTHNAGVLLPQCQWPTRLIEIAHGIAPQMFRSTDDESLVELKTRDVSGCSRCNRGDVLRLRLAHGD